MKKQRRIFFTISLVILSSITVYLHTNEVSYYNYLDYFDDFTLINSFTVFFIAVVVLLLWISIEIGTKGKKHD